MTKTEINDIINSLNLPDVDKERVDAVKEFLKTEVKHSYIVKNNIRDIVKALENTKYDSLSLKYLDDKLLECLANVKTTEEPDFSRSLYPARLVKIIKSVKLILEESYA